jgi:hypothetical protein
LADGRLQLQRSPVFAARPTAATPFARFAATRHAKALCYLFGDCPGSLPGGVVANRAMGDDSFDGIEDCKPGSVGNGRASGDKEERRPLWQRVLFPDRFLDAIQEMDEWLKAEDPEEPANPFGILMKARSRAGSIFAIELRKRIKRLNGDYYHFAMNETVSAPLGWTLSGKARRDLDALLNSKCHSTQVSMITKTLKGQ